MTGKIIGFTLNEQTVVEEEFAEQDVYNNSGKIINLGKTKYVRREPIGFSSKELGELFVEIGTKLQSMNNNINVIGIETILKENKTDMGKQILFKIIYKELEK